VFLKLPFEASSSSEKMGEKYPNLKEQNNIEETLHVAF
jgi:hypothetical protein